MGDAFRVGLGGPVGAGKTSLTASLCKVFSESLSMAVITNDIYTKEDAEILMKKQVINSERILAVETGGCPHTAIREDDLGVAGDDRRGDQSSEGGAG